MRGSAASELDVPSTSRISSLMKRRNFQIRKPYARQIKPSTTNTNTAIVRYTSSISRASGTSVLSPNVPTVYAIAPNAPIGASTITIATILKNTA